ADPCPAWIIRCPCGKRVVYDRWPPGHARTPSLAMTDMSLTPQSGPTRPVVPPTRKFRVLTVDDDADSVDLLPRCLGMEGCEVQPPRTGADALQVMGSARPDLVLLDLLIPPPDGLAVIRAAERDSGL